MYMMFFLGWNFVCKI